MNMMEWVICPICNNKTRIKIRKDTQLKNFPLYCPKCKKESLICVNNFKIEIIMPGVRRRKRPAPALPCGDGPAS